MHCSHHSRVWVPQRGKPVGCRATKILFDGSEVGRSPVEVGSLSTIFYGVSKTSQVAHPTFSDVVDFCSGKLTYPTYGGGKMHRVPATLKGDVLVLNVAFFFRPPRFNIAPEKLPFPKRKPDRLPTIHFQGRTVSIVWGVNERYELEPQTPTPKKRWRCTYTVLVLMDFEIWKLHHFRVVVYHPSLGKQLLQSYGSLTLRWEYSEWNIPGFF